MSPSSSRTPSRAATGLPTTQSLDDLQSQFQGSLSVDDKPTPYFPAETACLVVRDGDRLRAVIPAGDQQAVREKRLEADVAEAKLLGSGLHMTSRTASNGDRNIDVWIGAKPPAKRPTLPNLLQDLRWNVGQAELASQSEYHDAYVQGADPYSLEVSINKPNNLGAEGLHSVVQAVLKNELGNGFVDYDDSANPTAGPFDITRISLLKTLPTS